MSATKMARDASAGDVTSVYLQRQWRRIQRGATDLRSDDVAVHRTRVAIRRARSVLRVFPQLFDAGRVARMDVELAWYAGVLGAVRDPQVLRARLSARCDALADEMLMGPVAGRLDQHLLGEELRARALLQETLDSDRYRSLEFEIIDWGDDVPFTAAARRAPETLVRAVRRASRKPQRRLADVPVRPGPEQEEAIHRARKAAKRARYAAELARPVLGKKAAQQIRRGRHLQDVLGEHHDAVVAAGAIRTLGVAAGTREGENGFSYGLLYQQEIDAAAAAVQDVLGR